MFHRIHKTIYTLILFVLAILRMDLVKGFSTSGDVQLGSGSVIHIVIDIDLWFMDNHDSMMIEWTGKLNFSALICLR